MYVALADRVVELDAGTLAVRRTLALPAAPVALVLADRLWVALANGSVLLVNPAALAVTRTVPVAGPPAAIAVGGGRAYVSVPAPATLHVLDGATGAVTATRTDVGPEPDRLAVAPPGDLVYLTDRTGPGAAAPGGRKRAAGRGRAAAEYRGWRRPGGGGRHRRARLRAGLRATPTACACSTRGSGRRWRPAGRSAAGRGSG